VTTEDDRIGQLEATLARIAAELVSVRAQLAGLRDERGKGTQAGHLTESAAQTAAEPGQTARPSSRVEAFHQAMESSTSSKLPAGTWKDVFEKLGVQPAAGSSRTGRSESEPKGSATSRASREGLETLVGRYGTLALAALTILMGVGAFLGWAIRNGLIGPELRVALGATGAALLAVVGARMRRRANPMFGGVLLALSLAVVHVVAWGAGPKLHLVSDAGALTIAGLASAALSWLAWRDEQQALFNVGFGGALLAPFVTSSGGGNAVVMLVYGGLVLASGLAAMSRRQWRKTPIVVTAGVVLYAAIGIDALQSDREWARAQAPALFGLALAAVSLWLLKPPRRSALMYVALSTTLVALLATSNAASAEAPGYVLAIALTIVAFSAWTRDERGFGGALFGALSFPLGALSVALTTMENVASTNGTLTVLLWTALSSAAAVLNRDGERNVHSLAVVLMLGLAVALQTEDRPVTLCVAIAVLALVSAIGSRRLVLPGLAFGGAAWLVFATIRAFALLGERIAYDYTPFLTSSSVAAAAVSVAWIALSWHLARTLASQNRPGDLPLSIVRVLGGAIAFFWVREELAGAVSPDVSTFLLVAYYATTGLAAIRLGRALSIPNLRHLGLALAVFAAIKTIGESSGLAIGWRVAAYMLAGVFLLGVAYWYRRPDGTPDVEAVTREAGQATGKPH
jgi:uncharacterized membrane protein